MVDPEWWAAVGSVPTNLGMEAGNCPENESRLLNWINLLIGVGIASAFLIVSFRLRKAQSIGNVSYRPTEELRNVVGLKIVLTFVRLNFRFKTLF